MISKFICVAIVSSLAFTTLVGSLHLNGEEFQNYIREKCYTATKEGRRPVPYLILAENRDINYRYMQPGQEKTHLYAQSVENLIGLIEKIESGLEERKVKVAPVELAKILLRKYRIDDLTYQNGFFLMTEDIKHNYRIEDALLDTENFQLDAEISSIINSSLDKHENCSLHYLLSHNIDLVATDGDTKTLLFRANQSPNSQNNEPNKYKPRLLYSTQSGPLTKFPREYGVGTFRNDHTQAIALNKLLLGIIAGYIPTGQSQPSVRDVYVKLTRDANLENVQMDLESKIDPLMAVTIASVYEYGAYSTEQNKQNLFGARGEWKTSICPTEYVLNVQEQTIQDIKDIPGVAATQAELRGALDGYIIGKTIQRKQNEPKNQLTLSQILRFYYSQTGLTEGDGYCRRPNYIPQMDEIIRQAKSFRRIKVLLSAGKVSSSDNEVVSPITAVHDEFRRELEAARIISENDRNWCSEGERRGSGNDFNNYPCENPSDVFVLLDKENKLDEQKKLIGKLATELNMYRKGSSLTILTNGQGSDNTFYRVTWNETNKGCANCRLDAVDIRDDLGGLVSPDKFLRYLNDTLRDFDEMKKDEIAVPSRVFIIFNMGYMEKRNFEPRSRFSTDIRVLRRNHREVKYIVIGEEEKHNFLPFDDHSFFETKDSSLIEKISKEICKTPALFQHPECQNRPSSEDHYIGHITRGEVQNWAIFPRFYEKSYDITFRFESKEKLKVCHSRTPEPGYGDFNRYPCYENDGGEIKFTRKDPCHKYNLENCPIFYFTIFTPSEGTGEECNSEACANYKQIEYKFSHTGIRCNGALGITFSPLLTIISSLIAIAGVYFKKY
ncbi:hypothetical protein B4U79_09640 [Dinothrombium tinctorium]|uniref:Uncharacterized protein n=1 Tax=Dinothrombium tinctorium TaxID=1965070 RepID=A0A3S3PT22_9ACAR|nr:hypothetical protein B4U79_11718 [Dinothrombium tinctorium]RWS07716.1 hypothetical protein B4U79_09640 [Dinothrombium tinctorium]